MSTLVAASPVIASRQCRPALMVLVLVFTDVFTLGLSGLAALVLTHHIQAVEGPVLYATLIPALLLFVLVFSVFGLYSGVSPSAPEELRKSILACVLISWCVVASAVSIEGNHAIFSWTLGLAMLFSIVALPFARELVRLNCSRTTWWGYPVVVIGDEESGRQLIRVLNHQTGLGLKPIAMICSSPTERQHISGVPVIDELQLSDWEPYLKGRGYALLTGDRTTHESLLRVIAKHRSSFPHVMIVPETWEFSCFWVRPKNLGGFLGLEVRGQIFKPGRQLLKRTLDLFFTSLILLPVAPLLLAIAIAIKLDSAGPVFYAQRRVGRGGVEFRAWKFRSMVIDADEKLARYLESHPHLNDEWKQNHKLRDDPRITRVGKFLRRSSLDEFPQLWNVIRGDMSLVGPRPIVRDEISRYGKYFDLYTSVQSGLTGLWQVSGRSETSYEQRVNFDTFYVRNWSVWLDLCILVRTIGVLWLRTGAY